MRLASIPCFKIFHRRRKDEIKDIAVAASKELELEVKMRAVEEEWTEQVLSFSNYKRRGPVLLVKEDSERLLEQLEDAQALLANMLTSKHIGMSLLLIFVFFICCCVIAFILVASIVLFSCMSTQS